MDRKTNLVWIDLEMTGLDPAKDTILEIATIITDKELNVLEQGSVDAIHHSESALAAMDPWCVRQHGRSGLTERCRKSTTTLEKAETRAVEFVQKWCEEKVSPLCGNSIYQDKRFISKYMPKLNSYLSYRLIDVSTIKELVKRWHPEKKYDSGKTKTHQALDDIRSSIAELVHYRKTVFLPSIASSKQNS